MKISNKSKVSWKETINVGRQVRTEAIINFMACGHLILCSTLNIIFVT